MCILYERKLVLAGAFGQILDGEDKICIYAYDIINMTPYKTLDDRTHFSPKSS